MIGICHYAYWIKPDLGFTKTKNVYYIKLKLYSVTSWDNRRCPGDTDGWLTPVVALSLGLHPLPAVRASLLGLRPRLGLRYSGRASVLGLRPLPSPSVLNLPSIHGSFAPSIRATPSNFIFYNLTQYHSVNGACFLCHSAYMYRTSIFHLHLLDGQPI